MRVKKVNRYYCDFCKKSGGSKYWMEIHEKHCTMNPNRTCRMCEYADGAFCDTQELLNMLPTGPPVKLTHPIYPDDYSENFIEEMAKALPKLRELSGNCPACILAALRQRGIPMHAAPGFDFFQERDELFREYANTTTRDYGY